MKQQTKIVTDISPQVRVVSSEIQKTVFSRTYMAMIQVLFLFGILVGFGVSQMYETQKDLIALKKEVDLNNLLRMKQLTMVKKDVRQSVSEGNNLLASSRSKK